LVDDLSVIFENTTVVCCESIAIATNVPSDMKGDAVVNIVIHVMPHTERADS